MGYNIQYGSTIVKTAVSDKMTKSKGKNIVVAVLLAATILGYIVHSYYDVLIQYVIPGDPKITTAAFGDFIADIKKGETLSAAITAFCVEIIDNADISR